VRITTRPRPPLTYDVVDLGAVQSGLPASALSNAAMPPARACLVDFPLPLLVEDERKSGTQCVAAVDTASARNRRVQSG
jgi:hypothetical protein